LSAVVSVGLLLAVLIGAAALLGPGHGGSGHGTSAAPRRPNIVMIIDDDQTAEQQRFLTKTNAAIGGHGVTFDNSFVNFSLCCPSRSTLLTGQYAHNHGVLGDEPPAGGYEKLAPTLGNTLPVWLQRAGYHTGLFGKFLNHYGRISPTTVPPGWNDWYGEVDNHRVGGNYSVYGYTLNENGRLVHYGSRPSVVDPPAYETDVLSRLAAGFIRRQAPSGQPFFLYIAPRDPHLEPIACRCPFDNPRAAPRYEGTLAGLTAPRTASFNEADVSDKPAAVRRLPLLPPTEIKRIDARYRAEAESLLGVDDLVENVVRTLKQQGELANSVILFTSDNGFFHGEHRINRGKVLPYEPSIRVPLLIRAPGLPQGVHRRQLVGNVDLAPTILDFARASPGRVQDGRSLIPIMRDPRYWPGRGLELEAYRKPTNAKQGGNPPIIFQGVRTDRYMYARYRSGAQELYDLRKDPLELQNAASDPAYSGARTSLRRLLGELANCVGGACRSRPDLRLEVRGCSTAVVSGPGAPQDATFYLAGRRLGRDDLPPIRFGVPPGSRGKQLRAVVTSLDGRIVSLEQRLHC
jgi:N-acetylglucosamine-6-sulfatase